MKGKYLITGLVTIGLAVTTHAKAQTEDRLYVYTPKGMMEASYAFDELQTVTFTQQGMSFNTRNGSSASLLFDEVSTWVFQDMGTDMPSVSEIDEVRVFLRDEQVIVESSTEMSAVYLYNTQGVLLQQLNPNSLSVTIPFSHQASGIYVVKVIYGQDQISTHKILKH